MTADQNSRNSPSAMHLASCAHLSISVAVAKDKGTSGLSKLSDELVQNLQHTLYVLSQELGTALSPQVCSGPIA